jgi:hypothetical protein
VDSEHVVLANIFGVVKNLSPDTALNAWLSRSTNGRVPPAPLWRFDLWQKQPRPQGVIEGSTKRLSRNTLPHLALFYENKLCRSPRREASPFVAYAQRDRDSYQGWQSKAWAPGAAAPLPGRRSCRGQSVAQDSGGCGAAAPATCDHGKASLSPGTKQCFTARSESTH